MMGRESWSPEFKILVPLLSVSHSPDSGCVMARRVMFLGRFLVQPSHLLCWHFDVVFIFFPLHMYLIFFFFLVFCSLPSYMGSFSQTPLPQVMFLCISLQNLVLLLPPIFFIKTLKAIAKKIHILPSWVTIPGRRIGTSACYPLGHQYLFKLFNLIG